jgi:predicted site-specific integrase-resolvase
MEETFTDKEFCQTFKINRATSLHWREAGIVGYVKLPNGSVRYRQKHMDELWANFEKMEKLGVTLKDLSRALKSGVVHIGVPESGRDIAVTEHAGDFGNRQTTLHEAGSTGVA